MNYSETMAYVRTKSDPDVYAKSVEFQHYLGEHGIAWHNVFADECVADFNCCTGSENFDTYFPSYLTFLKQIFAELFDAIKHGDQEHQDWLKNELNQFLNDIHTTI